MPYVLKHIASLTRVYVVETNVNIDMHCGHVWLSSANLPALHAWPNVNIDMHCGRVWLSSANLPALHAWPS